MECTEIDLRGQAAVWQLLGAAGNRLEDLARLTGHDPDRLRAAVAPWPNARHASDDSWWLRHRARLELHRCLDRLDTAAGPDACWETTGRLQQGRAVRRSSLLATTSLARQVLMVTSQTLAPSPGLVAAHTCHNAACGNYRHLVWASRPENADHRRRRRLGLPVAARPEDTLVNTDVAEVPIVELRALAMLERQAARLTPAGADGGCLVVAGTAGHDHYSHVAVDGKQHKLHRWLLTMAGVDLTDVLVLHGCDRKPCVALRCLRPGDARANALDAVARGRAAAGPRHPRAYYTDEQVAEILSHQPRDLDVLQARFGGSRTAIADVLAGRTYRHVPRPAAPRLAHRRLTGLGVRTVRTLRACGATEAQLAERFDHTTVYLRELAAGTARPQMPGPLTPAPGPANGRQVATGRLTRFDHHWIAKRTADGASGAATARELEVNPSSVARALHPR